MKKLFFYFLFIVGVVSCKPEANDCDYRFEVVNETIHYIKVIVYYKNYEKGTQEDSVIVLNPNSDIKFEYIRRIPGNAFDLPADSTCITFDESRQLIYRKDDGNPRNILELNSYESSIENEYWYIFQYVFTNEDFENAIEIK